MPKSSPNQTNFLGGEWSQWAQGRTEDPRYATALATCLNSYPVEEGALIRRPGTEFIAYPYLNAQPRLLNFEGETAAAYCCEFTVTSGQGYLRFIQGNTMVVDDDSGSPAIITANDGGNPVTVTVASTPATWATGDQAILFFPNPFGVANMGGLAGQLLTLTKTDPTHYQLADENGVNVNASAWAGTTLVGAALRRVTRLTTPYTAYSQLQILRMIQNEQLAVLVTPKVAPQVLNECPTFAISQAALVDGPYLTPQTNTATVSGFSGAITLTASSATFASSDTSGAGGTGSFNRHVRLWTEPAAYSSGTTYSVGQYVKYNGQYWISNLASNTGNAPGSSPLINGVATAAWAPVAARGVAQWAWGTITGYTSTTIVTVTLQSSLLSANGTAVAASNWQLGAYCDSLGYPACGCYHEGRLWLMGYAPNRFDASTVSDPTLVIGSGFLCFSPTDIDGTVNDSNAISYTLNSKETNPILWAVPDQQGIICGTLGAEFVLQATTAGDPLTPTDIQAHRVTKYGSSNVEPVQAGMSIIFVQRYQQRLMEYLADTFSQRWSGKHLNEMSKHIAKTGVAEIAYQEELTPIIWCRMNDGSLAGVTYRRVSRFVSENPVFSGWHRHQMGADNAAIARTFEAMCVTPQPGGRSDRLYLASKRGDGTHRRLEVAFPIMRETDGLGAAAYVDDSPACASTPYFNNCTTAATAAANAATKFGSTLTGWGPDGSAALGGTTPSRSGIVGVAGGASVPDLSGLLNPAGSSLTGSPGSFAVPGPSGSPFNLAFREAVYFDGSTCLYNLPTGFRGASNLSISFWIPADDLFNGGTGALLTAPIRKLGDYSTVMACPMPATTPSPTVGFQVLDFWNQTWIYGDAGTDLLALDCIHGDTGPNELDVVSSVEWAHVMIAYQASTMTCTVYINNTIWGSFTMSWDGPGSMPAGGSHTCGQTSQANPPSSFPLPNFADNYYTGFGGNNMWTIGGTAWQDYSTLGHVFPGEIQNSAGTVKNLDTNSYMSIDTGAPTITPYSSLSLPGNGLGIVCSMTELWISKTFVDWSVQANREKFHTKEFGNVTGLFAPVYLGNSGEKPTGSAPLVYCSGLNPTPGVQAYQAFPLNHAAGKALTVFSATAGLINSSHAFPS